MTVGDERILNKKTTEAREVIIEWLKNEGLLEKEEEVIQNISTAERTGGIIEPLPKLQWFINVNKKIPERENKTLKELMLEVVKNKSIGIIPERFERVYYNWIENLRDWCISRQIWYGHRIPVWYRKEISTPGVGASFTPGVEIYCDVNPPEDIENWEQDPDTLDAWFSSGLWTFSTLGWPDLESPGFKNYHPTTVLETGHDIIFFWVARMILMSTYLIGDIPFKTVYLHGIVRDAKGEKMSKSLGNALDPIVVSEEYGADAVRMSLIIGTGPGNDSKMSEDKIRAYKNYANKLWNISRFVFSACDGINFDKNFDKYVDKDNELIKERNEFISDITKDMESFRFYMAGEKIYQYTWARLADIIIEESKNIILNGKIEEKKSRQQFLLHTLEKILKVLHPFMPFVTEEIWGIMPKEDKNLLIVERWPIL